MNKTFLEFAKDRQKKRSKRKKQILMKRPKSLKPLERLYFKEIKEIINYINELIPQNVISKIDQIIQKRQRDLPKKDSINKFDDWVDEIDAVFDNLKTSFYFKYTDEIFDKISRNIATDINVFNLKNINDAFLKQYSIPSVSVENWLQPEIKAFTKTNVKLIKSISEQHFSKLESLITRKIQAGALTSDIKEIISNEYNVSEKRAALIARDQTNKFNGNLNELRQTDLGIQKYVWETSMDEKVRTEHEARQGKTFNWNNPPFDGHPGEAINCRCVAIGIFEE